MPLQNRVTPHGDIIATHARGTMIGNRGVLHDEQKASRPPKRDRPGKERAWRCNRSPISGLPARLSVQGGIADQSGPSIKDCDVDAYVPGHNWSRSTGLTAAVDAGVVARGPADFIDLVKARAVIKPLIASGFAMCVWRGEDWPVPNVMGAVLADTGVSIEHDQCVNHVHSDAWEVVPYVKLANALTADSPFAPAWTR